MNTSTITGKDLTKEPARSPRLRIGGYAILARTADKCRALLGGNLGEYHYDCPLDNMLFGFKNVTGEDFKAQIESGASDEQIAQWLDENGTPKTADEVEEWSASVEATSPYGNPEKREWFSEQCKSVGIDPARSTLFGWLEVDDRVSFAK